MRFLLPVAAIALAGGSFGLALRFDPEPELRTWVGTLILAFCCVGLQSGLFMCPIVRSRRARLFSLAAMVPCAVVLAGSAVDLVQRLVRVGHAPVAWTTIVAFALLSYGGGFAFLLKSNASGARGSTAPS
jgi:ABC-type uncharacterized transport system permease subunit